MEIRGVKCSEIKLSVLEKILLLVVTVLAVTLIVVIAVWASEETTASDTADSAASVVASHMRAKCRLHAQPGRQDMPSLDGVITFTQSKGQHLNVNVAISGLPAANASEPAVTTGRGLHVHFWGDVTGGCGTTGGHYNPRDVPHRGPTDTVRHPGDFGNFPQTEDGNITKSWNDDLATLYGPESIIGRAMVLHQGQDDLGTNLQNSGSQSNGNAGPRMACCVIGLVDPS